MRLFFTLFLLTSCSSICFSQQGIETKRSKVKLLKWNAEACDNTYDPYRLQNRITHVEVKNGITSITVNFTDNCCAAFKPEIEFKASKLTLLPYRKYFGDYCMCDCCFSISFEIQGIDGKDFEVYFKGKKIEVSGDHYKTIEPTYVMHNGEKINRTNRYGFQEGIWIEFYDNGARKSVSMYPESSLYYESDYEWSKEYFESGRLSFYSRNDTTESWFKNGDLESQVIKYSVKDTTFEKRFRTYENKQLRERSLERHYPFIFKSEFDSTAKQTGSKFDYVYREEYYRNGQQKYLHRKDTSYSWYENGQVEYKEYHSGKLEYTEQGQLVERQFHWNEPGIKGWRDLDYSAYVSYYENGIIKEIHFVRDEPSKDGKSFAPGVHYYWKWDREARFMEAPENWREDLPWKNNNEIKLLLANYKLN